jgi:hypothetical protein
MKYLIITISLATLFAFASCIEKSSNINVGNKGTEQLDLLIPIQYDFDDLKLTLNSSISDSVSDLFWRWDYMNSDNGGPDSTGIDYFMNINQPEFLYNGEATLPCLSIKTNKNRIIEFSATVLFNIADKKSESIKNVLDSLTAFDLLNDPKIKQSIIDHGVFKSNKTNYEEMIEVKIADQDYEYDRITYEIKKI